MPLVCSLYIVRLFATWRLQSHGTSAVAPELGQQTSLAVWRLELDAYNHVRLAANISRHTLLSLSRSEDGGRDNITL